MVAPSPLFGGEGVVVGFDDLAQLVVGGGAGLATGLDGGFHVHLTAGVARDDDATELLLVVAGDVATTLEFQFTEFFFLRHGPVPRVVILGPKGRPR